VTEVETLRVAELVPVAGGEMGLGLKEMLETVALVAPEDESSEPPQAARLVQMARARVKRVGLKLNMETSMGGVTVEKQDLRKTAMALQLRLATGMGTACGWVTGHGPLAMVLYMKTLVLSGSNQAHTRGNPAKAVFMGLSAAFSGLSGVSGAFSGLSGGALVGACS
jgi:hypothetical protein